MILYAQEWQPKQVATAELSDEDVAHLQAVCSDYVDIRFDRSATTWRLLFSNCAGVIGLPSGNTIEIQPKMGLPGLLHMMCWAVRARPLLDTMEVPVSTSGLMQAWARTYAREVGRLVRRGLYKNYLSEEAVQPEARGRLLTKESIARNRGLALVWRYDELTVDNLENQILLAGLRGAERLPGLPADTRTELAGLRRLLDGLVSNVPVTSKTIDGLPYHRLNRHYELAHQLAKIFVSLSAPDINTGQQQARGFLLDLPTLFEDFWAEWVRHHLPPDWTSASQDSRTIAGLGIRFRPDLVLKNLVSGRTIIIDTKYKHMEEPSPADVQQVVAYAAEWDADSAFLAYPVVQSSTKTGVVGRTGQRGVSVTLVGIPVDAAQDESRKRILESMLAQRS